MKHNTAYIWQGRLFCACALGGIGGFGAKSILSSDPTSAPFIGLDYFLANINRAGPYAFVYWVGVAIFITSILLIAIIEKLKVPKS